MDSSKNKKSITVSHILYHYYKSDARVKAYCTYLEENGYEVLVLDCEYFGIPKIQGKIFRAILKQYLVFFVKVMFKLVMNPKIKLIHVNNIPNFFVFAGMINKIVYGAKIILDNHDVMPIAFTEKSSNKIIYKILLIEQFLSMKFADFVICADHNQKDYLILNRIPKDRLSVVLNVANDRIFKKKPFIVSPNKSIQLIYHGTISQRLGIDLIIEALRIVSEKIPNVHLNLIGEGDYSDHIKRMVDQYHLENHVQFTDKLLPVEDLPIILEKMNIGVIGNRITTLSDYMLPVKLLEYIHMKIPVVAPKSRIIDRYFDEEMLSYYEPEDFQEMASKIIELILNPEKRQDQAKKAFSFTKIYNYRSEMIKYQAIIDKLISSQGA